MLHYGVLTLLQCVNCSSVNLNSDVGLFWDLGACLQRG